MGKYNELDEEALDMLYDYVKQPDIKDSDKIFISDRGLPR